MTDTKTYEADFASIDNLHSLIGVACGAVSVCWEFPDKAGVFDSTEARKIVDAASAQADKIIGRGDLVNARRELDKAQTALARCEEFFRHQAEMNAAAHMATNVMYSPLHASISSVLQGIETFKGTP